MTLFPFFLLSMHATDFPFSLLQVNQIQRRLQQLQPVQVLKVKRHYSCSWDEKLRIKFRHLMVNKKMEGEVSSIIWSIK